MKNFDMMSVLYNVFNCAIGMTLYIVIFAITFALSCNVIGYIYAAVLAFCTALEGTDYGYRIIVSIIYK